MVMFDEGIVAVVGGRFGLRRKRREREREERKEIEEDVRSLK